MFKKRERGGPLTSLQNHGRAFPSQHTHGSRNLANIMRATGRERLTCLIIRPLDEFDYVADYSLRNKWAGMLRVMSDARTEFYYEQRV